MKTTIIHSSIHPRSLHTGLLALALLTAPVYAVAQAPAAASSLSTQLTEKTFDDVLARYFSAQQPGATVRI